VPVPGGGIAGTQRVISSLAEHSVIDISWWQVPGQPKAVLTWIEAHGPAGLRGGSTGSAGPMAVPGQLVPSSTDKPTNVYRMWTDYFDRYSGPAVLDTQQLMVDEIQNGLGQTVMRVDTLVSWVPPSLPFLGNNGTFVSTVLSIPGLTWLYQVVPSWLAVAGACATWTCIPQTGSLAYPAPPPNRSRLR
jgi:hypothetical protein